MKRIQIEIENIGVNINDYPHGTRIFAMINTIGYNGPHSPFGALVVAVRKKKDLRAWGWKEKEELNAVWALEDGEKYDSNDYGNSASIVRLA